jgi:Uma2 family endonuclease
MMSAVVAKTTYSPEEYLALERSSAYKSEFHDGQIHAMTGASREHNLIAVNIAGELRTQLKNRPCEAYLADMRVKAAEARSYHYPDIAVVCGTPQFEDSHLDTLLNPTVLIEVLSSSTEAYDRGGKFAHYRKIESVREYLVVSQDQPRIERYARQQGGWILTEAEGLEGVVTLEAIGCSLALREVYDKVLPAPTEHHEAE